MKFPEVYSSLLYRRVQRALETVKETLSEHLRRMELWPGNWVATSANEDTTGFFKRKKKKRKESVGSIAFSMSIYCSEVSDSECIIMA